MSWSNSQDPPSIGFRNPVDVEAQLRKTIRNWILFFIIFLVLSGVSAFPLTWEVSFLVDHSQNAPQALRNWLLRVEEALLFTSKNFPFMAYGTDWLALAHIVIATAFIGPLRDPVRNIWVIQFGMIACLLVIPVALICGPIRGIPFFWQMIDCSFGVIGIVPLYFCYRKIRRLEGLEKRD